MVQTVFNRYEKKYLMPPEVYRELRQALEPHLQVDDYGLHTICNLYYDTLDDLLIRRSIAAPAYKEKLRLRSYGIPQRSSQVFLEIKKKYDGVVNKRRLRLSLQQVYDYTDRSRRPDESQMSPQERQILRELDFFLERYPLWRRLCLCYDRLALFGREDADFRVTFDANIRYRRRALLLEQGDEGRLLLPPGWVLMESKVMGATPLWFTAILSRLGLYTTSFSKYGNIYRQELGCWDPLAQMTHRLDNWRSWGLIGREEAC